MEDSHFENFLCKLVLPCCLSQIVLNRSWTYLTLLMPIFHISTVFNAFLDLRGENIKIPEVFEAKEIKWMSISYRCRLTKWMSISYRCRLTKWIAFQVRSDWLLKIRISFAFRLQAIRTGFILETIAVVRGKELNSYFCTLLSHCFNIYFKKIFTSVSVASVRYLPRRFAAR